MDVIDLSSSNRKPWPKLRRRPEEVSYNVLSEPASVLGDAIENTAFGFSYEGDFGTLPDLTGPQPGTTEIAPGITPVKPSVITPPTPTPSVPNDTVQDIVKNVGNIGSGFTKIKLSDGTEIEGVGAQPTLPGGDTDKLPVRSGASISVDRPGVLPIAEEKQSFYGKLNNFVSSPTFRAMLAQTGAALGQGSPGIQQAAGFAMQLAQSDAAKEYKKALEEGRDPDEIKSAGILTPEMKQKIQTAFDKKSSDKIKEDYTRALTRQADAISKGTLTAEDKKRQSMLELSVSQELGYLRDGMMNLGQGHVLDMESGNVHKAYDYQSGSSGQSILGNLNAATFKSFDNYNNATFLPMAMENKRNEMLKTHGPEFVQLSDLSAAFKNNDGTTNVPMLMKYLTPEQKIQYASALNQYTQNFAQGVPQTGTFLQHQIQQNAPSILKDQNSGMERTDENGIVWRLNPATGTEVRVR